MANAQFALTSKLHAKNICSGLSHLQQNGELVDMTLAADGHLVKVHQVILALASPYLKDLISSAQCQHPVIFLNKISFTTLSAMLEYIYTGEVLVTIHNLKELVEVGKELHIKGLKDMEHIGHNKEEIYEKLQFEKSFSSQSIDNDTEIDNGELLYERESEDLAEETVYDDKGISDYHRSEQQETFYEDTMEEESGDLMESMGDNALEHHVNKDLEPVGAANVKVGTASKNNADGSTLQFTVSNQGSLQMILNRYVYYLKYTNRNRSRQWRCVDYLKSARCPAHVITRDDVVVQRIAAHTHSFHDQRILKKVRAGAIFSAIVEAEREGENILRSKGIGESNVQSE